MEPFASSNPEDQFESVYTSYYMLRTLRSHNISSKRVSRPDEYTYEYTVYNYNDEALYTFYDNFPSTWIPRKNSADGEWIIAKQERIISIMAQLTCIFDEVSYFQKPPLEFVMYKKRFIPKWDTRILDSYNSLQYRYTKGKAMAFAYLAESIEEYHRNKHYEIEHEVRYGEALAPELHTKIKIPDGLCLTFKN
ncbi:hypothetical protein WG906_08760 [Pedobacter sp. P351]|uniref:hypothetical protein n=1 Tax=Pedobacter superstes TaxID=3133441 RepID=UPI0030AE1FE9